MTNPYQMNYKAPIADNWTHQTPAASETVDEVSSMLERLKAESTSLESYVTDLECELKRVHVQRKVVGKKLGVLSELARDVEALRANPAPMPAAVEPAKLSMAPAPVVAGSRPSRTTKIVCAVSIVVVALAVTFIALEQTGQIHSCVSCAPARLLGLM